jgi:hypothetical protein
LRPAIAIVSSTSAREDRADPGHRLDAARDRIGKTDLLQHVERRQVDALQVRFGHRLEVAAIHARPDRTLIHGERRRTQRPARLPPPAAARFGLNDTHWMALTQNSDKD